MKPAIKFVKDNLVPVICGLVVLLGLIAWLVWPLPGWQADLQETMKTRYAQVTAAKGMVSTITLPGGQILQNATYEPNVVAAADHAQKYMAEQASQIIKVAAAQNQAGRIKVTPARTIPLLAGIPEDNYLPAIDRSAGEPYGFKVDYEKQFTLWTSQLIGKDNVPGTPPLQSDLTAALTAEKLRAAAPMVGNPMFAGSAAAAGGAADAAETARYERNALAKRASEIKMYVDLHALQTRDWFGKSNPPTEPQIFEALVDCWFQQDVINALLDVNKNSTSVATSAVKRLEKITVGVAPGANGGSTTGVFYTATGAVPGAAPAAPVLDLTRTMTGRTSNAQYDVVLENISVDLDPAYQNAFIAALYRQNNGYTVLNITTKVLDPFDTTSNGYLYGNTQVVHVDILVEGILFRSWTLPIMPDATKTMLGIPITPPTPAAPAVPAT